MEPSPEEYSQWKDSSLSEKEDFLQYLREDDLNVVREVPGENGKTRSKRAAAPNLNGIGRLIMDAGPGLVGICTASNTGGRWWITAAHCVAGKEDKIGFIKQPDGEYAGVEAVFTRGDGIDIGVVRVGSGINATEMRIDNPVVRDNLRLTQFGFPGNMNPNTGDLFYVTVDGTVIPGKTSESFHDSSGMWHADEFAVQYDHAWISGGDSGGPLFIDNQIYGITATVVDGTNYGHAAKTAPHTWWMNDRKRYDGGSSFGERWKARKGGTWARFARKS